jgi:BirA family biotin operon repressor/biotin-[acetyl-CoA-carboxylase] ligase
MASPEIDPLDIPRLHVALQSHPIGREIIYLPEVDSTNRFVRELGPDRVGHGLIVLTDFQLAGRGRRGRVWHAAPGSALLTSVVLAGVTGAPQTYLVMVAALAAADAIGLVTGRRAQLKWPNDVLLSGRKVCGILAERCRFETYYVIGIGVNVLASPNERDVPADAATSLNSMADRPVSRTDFAVALFKSLNMWYRMLTQEPGSIFEEWAHRLAVAGVPLEVHERSGTWRAVAVEVQRDGGLLVENDDGSTQTLYAADVTVRTPLYSQGDGE